MCGLVGAVRRRHEERAGVSGGRSAGWISGERGMGGWKRVEGDGELVIRLLRHSNRCSGHAGDDAEHACSAEGG